MQQPVKIATRIEHAPVEGRSSLCAAEGDKTRVHIYMAMRRGASQNDFTIQREGRREEDLTQKQ